MGTGLRALHRPGWFMRRGLDDRGTHVRCAASWLLAAQGVPQVAAPERERAVIVCKTVGPVAGSPRQDLVVRACPLRARAEEPGRTVTVSHGQCGADPQVTRSAGGGATAPQASQADSASSILVTRS